jgi:prepilin-type N-terminal cleavage/methylation domain-containing protein
VHPQTWNQPCNRELAEAIVKSSQSGFTLIEVVTVIAIMGIALGVTALNLMAIDPPLKTGTILFEAYLRDARLKAISNTSAFRVTPTDSGELDMQFAANCSASTWTDSNVPTLFLPDDVVLANTGWVVCFSPRGISDNNLKIVLAHPGYGIQIIEVLLGGTTRRVE